VRQPEIGWTTRTRQRAAFSLRSASEIGRTLRYPGAPYKFTASPWKSVAGRRK
jgi:hypothetical protein